MNLKQSKGKFKLSLFLGLSIRWSLSLSSTLILDPSFPMFPIIDGCFHCSIVSIVSLALNWNDNQQPFVTVECG